MGFHLVVTDQAARIWASTSAKVNTTKAWFTTDVNGATVLRRAVAENVIALIVTPRLAKAEERSLQTSATHSPLAPSYSYDSTGSNALAQLNPKSQLPPVVQLTMIAIDDKSAEKLDLDARRRTSSRSPNRTFSPTRGNSRRISRLWKGRSSRSGFATGFSPRTFKSAPQNGAGNKSTERDKKAGTPRIPSPPDFATKTDATLDNYARFRIVSTNKFAP